MKKYILPSIHKKVKTVILANGEYPTHEIPLTLLANCKHLVACDGATNKLVEKGKVPDAIVGDCDSLSDENKKKFASIIHQIKEQETNDLTKAFNYSVQNGWKDIIILGATGKREDHTIGNISLLCEYMHKANVKLLTNHGIFIAIDSDSTFESYEGQQISLFSMNNKPLSTKGLAYEISNQSFDRWWQATLNEAVGSEFTIETEGIVIVYLKY